MTKRIRDATHPIRPAIRIRSWHLVLTPTRIPDRYRTLCGRNAFGPTVAEMPQP